MPIVVGAAPAAARRAARPAEHGCRRRWRPRRRRTPPFGCTATRGWRRQAASSPSRLSGAPHGRRGAGRRRGPRRWSPCSRPTRRPSCPRCRSRHRPARQSAASAPSCDSPGSHVGAASACPGPSSTNVATSEGSRTRRLTIAPTIAAREAERNRNFAPTGGLPTLDCPMARTLRLIAVLLAAATLLLPAAAHAAGPRATRAALASQMRAGRRRVGRAGGRPRQRARRSSRRGPTSPRMPASVNKLFTTSTALTLYGATGHLTTSALGDVGVDPGGVLNGNLYLHGGGDPSFGSLQLSELADQLVLDQGLREITGRVIGDESAFDALRGPPSEGYRTTFEVGGPLSALTFNRGRTGKRRPYFQASPARFAAREFDKALRTPRRHHRRAPRGPGGRRRRALPLAEHSSPTLAELARVHQPPVGQLQRRDADQGARLRVRHRRHDARRRGRRAAHDGGASGSARRSSTARASRAPTARRRARSSTLLDHMSTDAAGPAFETSLAVAGPQRHAVRPHAAHRGARPLPGQDRHAAATSRRSPATARRPRARAWRSRSS